MMPRVLGLMLVLGCASGRGGAPAPHAAAAGDSTAAEVSGVCERTAAVTVHVDNTSSMDVQISFGSYTPARAAEGFSKTTYRIARSYLNNPIQLRILRGGIEATGPAQIPTEPVVCNDATLIIGPRPSNSFFYGDVLRGRSPKPRDGDTTKTESR